MVAPALSTPCREIDDEPRPSNQKFVSVHQLLFAAYAHEYSRARAEVREHDRARLFLDDAVLLIDEGVVCEHEVADHGADLESISSRYDARAGRPSFENLHDPKGRGPLGRRIEVRRVGIRTVVGNRILFDANQLIPDEKLVPEAELDRSSNPEKNSVALLEIVEP